MTEGGFSLLPPPPGIAFSHRETWRQLRCFSLTTLRNFGMGRRSLEARIQEGIGFLVEEFWKTQGPPFDPLFVLRCSVPNAICSVVFGERFTYDGRDLQVLPGLIQENFRPIDTAWVQVSQAGGGPGRGRGGESACLDGWGGAMFDSREEGRLGRCSCPDGALPLPHPILQRFDPTSPVAPEDLAITPEYGGLGSAPRQYQLCLTPRRCARPTAPCARPQ
ncbi:hypothetical protein lerEdw1_009968, partial [Lerista edwardsae]